MSPLLTAEEEAMLAQAVIEAHEVHEEIPPNSNTILRDETTVRFSSAIWYESIKSKTILLAGLGGIGSWVALLLGRLQPKMMFICDDDIVDATNMSGQFYSIFDAGKAKTTAACTMLANYANYYSPVTFNEKYTKDSGTSDIMICGFDNMLARKIFFNNWKNRVESLPEERRKECLYLDGRLAAEIFQILCIRGDDTYNMERYEREFLFSDIEADETICSYKQTSFCANMIASCMVNLFVNFCANECNPLIERDLPFLTSYNAETMYFKTEA